MFIRMKNTLTFLFIILSTTVYSQQLEILSSSGSFLKGNRYQLEYTLGDVVINTVSNNQNILTQGFHQPTVDGMYKAASNIVIDFFSEINSSFVYFEVEEGMPQDMKVYTYDYLGRLLIIQNFIGNRCVVDTSPYASSAYLFVVTYLGDKVESFKTIKQK